MQNDLQSRKSCQNKIKCRYFFFAAWVSYPCPTRWPSTEKTDCLAADIQYGLTENSFIWNANDNECKKPSSMDKIEQSLENKNSFFRAHNFI